MRVKKCGFLRTHSDRVFLKSEQYSEYFILSNGKYGTKVTVSLTLPLLKAVFLTLSRHSNIWASKKARKIRFPTVSVTSFLWRNH